MASPDLAFTPATELSALIRAKKLSPVELTRAVLDRIERLNPVVNAFCTLTADQALAAAREAEQALAKGEARGALHGIPFSIKDLHYTKDVRTMSGSFIFEQRVPDVDPPVVRRLKQAGGILLGKTPAPPRRPAWARSIKARTAPARSGFPADSAAFSGSSRRTAAFRCGRSRTT